jgi:hypothetical protein
MSDSTATTVTASGTTGGTCQTSGPYRCARHTNIVVFFKRGDRFAADPVDGRSTTGSIVSGT